MKPVLTPAEMAEADRRAIAGGTPEAVLVERAGRAVARHALAILGGAYGRRVVVVSGKGNNGADGLVAARVLAARGVGVDVFRLADGIDGVDRAVGRADLAIDAMFGTGFRGALDGDAARAADAIRSVRTLAVDIPSGVNGTTGEVSGVAVTAQETTCFVAAKPGLLFEPGRSHAGRVRVVDIGTDPGAATIAVPELRDLRLPSRGATDHKWTSGLFVFGGSKGMLGAPAMTGRAAARSGAAIVVCGVPAAGLGASEIITRALPATSDGHLDEDAARLVVKELHRYRALAIGPGLGRDDRAQAAARRLVAEAALPVVIDADALNALATDTSPLRVRHAQKVPRAVLTPHAAEYERLAGHPVGADRVGAARDLAAQTQAVVVLKGPGTVIAEPAGRAVVNPTDTAALATAGTGDVLTGIIGGLLANGADPFAAAVTGAYVHGRAARVAGTGDDLVAIDLIAALHRTLDALRQGHDPGED
ncbi:MAG TPA: NAD(P)H-hydrate dehydratase [Acidimicrobiia bacterium]|nr:NAD(P)H-hydrate dehydratase [Acidimicrobiia bacterium]